MTGRRLSKCRISGAVLRNRRKPPPVGLVNLPRDVGHFQDQQEQVLPHLPGQAPAIAGRKFRKGVGQVLVDHAGSQPAARR